MKRQSYLTTPRGGLFASPGRLLVAVLAFGIFLLLVLRLAAPGVLTTITSPLMYLGSGLTNKVGDTLESRAELLASRDTLQAEVEALRNEKAVLQARVTDFERLLGGRTERTAGILAGVIARPPVSPYDVLILDQGTNTGVRVGAHAYGPGGVPLGFVTEANPETSRVTLYSHTGNVTEGWAGETRIPVKLTGTGAGGFDAEIPGTLGAVVGDRVYVPGPGALPIATITEVVTDPSSPSVVLRIQATVNPFTITWVTIE